MPPCAQALEPEAPGREPASTTQGKGASFSYPLRARYPAKVSVPRSLAYEYYTPERRVLVPPADIEVVK